MADVTFDDPSDNNTPLGGAVQAKQGFITRLIIKSGLAKTEGGANTVMVVIIVIALVWVGYYALSDGGAGNSEPIFLEDLTEEQRSTLPPEILQTIPSRN